MPKVWTTSGVDLHLEVVVGAGRRVALEQAIRAAVANGSLTAGARLPSTRAFAHQLGLSRGTVGSAYDQLVAEGYLVSLQGSRTQVSELVTRPPASLRRPQVIQRPRFDLRPGLPDVTAFPTSAWLRASRRALTRTSASAFGYGDPQGRPELRQALADYLGRTRGVRAVPEQIVITSGYVQALALLTQTLSAGGKALICMEDPNLPFHREVARRAGATVVGLPVDDRGIRVEVPPASEFGAVSAVVVTPAHQYPLGVTLHPDRRRQLISWARETGALVIEDDYDGEFRYDRRPVGALQEMGPDCVAYLGTTSKTLGPELRLGWMVLPPGRVDAAIEAKLHADHHTDALAQLALANLLSTYVYDRHVRTRRLRYRGRRDLLQAVLGQSTKFGAAGFRLAGIAAGLHAVLTLPLGGEGEAEVRARAEAAGLGVGYLAEHWHGPSSHPQGVIVGFGASSDAAFPAAVRALVAVLTKVKEP